MDLLRRIAVNQEAAIIVVTHDESIFSRFDRIFHLRDGRLVSVDDPRSPQRLFGPADAPNQSTNRSEN